MDDKSERSFTSVDAPPERDLDMESGAIVFTWGQMRYVLPGRIAGLLYFHQKSGLEWLWVIHTKGEGGILGDDMGLGKTMQVNFYMNDMNWLFACARSVFLLDYLLCSSKRDIVRILFIVSSRKLEV